MFAEAETITPDFALADAAVPLDWRQLMSASMAFIGADGIGSESLAGGADWRALIAGFAGGGFADAVPAHAGLNGDAERRRATIGARLSAHWQDLLLPALFLAAIGIVLALTDWTGRGGAVMDLENRNAARLPALPRSLGELGAFPQQFGAFFADRFGLRRTMVRWRGWIALGLLHNPQSPGVVVGRDGWLFFGGDRSFENWQRKDPLSPAALDAWAAGLRERERWFAARGITYLYVVAPDKQTIYPELMPASLPPGSGETRLEQLARRMAGDPAWFDLRPTLWGAKDHGVLYLRGDTHWADLGAYEAYRAIMQRLGLPALPHSAANLAHYDHQDDLARMAGRAETEPVLAASTACAVRDPSRFDAALFDRDPPGVKSLRAFELAATRCERGRERLLVFHDSFVGPMLPYLSDSFARVVYVWRQPSFAHMQAIVAAEHPTVVIEERLERMLILPLEPSGRD